MERKWLFKILRYVLGLLIALLIGWGFYGFIKDDNWIAVSALATLILAIAAFLSIKTTMKENKLMREERRLTQELQIRHFFLNEIIDWAIDVSKCGIVEGFPDASSVIDLPAVYSFLSSTDNIDKLLLSFKAIEARNHHIREIASDFRVNLQKAIKEVIEHLEVHIGLVHKCKFRKPSEFEGAANKVVESKYRLDFLVKTIIEEASKIKNPSL